MLFPSLFYSLPVLFCFMRVLFAISSIGLGHATRDLPLIRALLREGHEVFVVSAGNALGLLRKEVPACRFFDVPDYPNVFTSKKLSSARLFGKSPLILNHVRREHRIASLFQRKYDIDRIVTDSRYGFCSRSVPSFWITNQLRYMCPRRFTPVELAIQYMHSLVQKRFINALVPDYEHDSLSGDLNHNLRFIDMDKVTYLGVLSSIQKRDVGEDVDYFISLSAGNRTAEVFERLVLDGLASLPGRVVVAKGNPQLAGDVDIVGNATVFGYLDRAAQADMMNRSRHVICRSGYTTLMELAELNKKAFFVPIPCQTEQNYLAQYHKQRGNCNFSDQSCFSLARVPDLVEGYSGFRRRCCTKDSVEKFLSVL